MHTHIIRTQFTFGDRVQFRSATQGCSGIGKINGITIDESGHYYLIEPDGEAFIQGGISEDEIAPLSSGSES